MILKTEAIVLTMRPFSQTSRMVSWLTRDYGAIVTPVKGACRSKSLFLGKIDIGYRSELLFYEREHGGVHHIKETTPLDYREGLRDSWRGAVAASYICSLTSQSVESVIDSAQLFDDLDSALTALAAGDEPEDVIIAYEFVLLDRLGLMPNFDYCRECPLNAAERSCRFVISSGRLSCFGNKGFDSSKDTVALSSELLSALRLVAAGAKQSHFSPSVRIGIRRFLGMFLSHHLDLSLYSRRAAFEWLCETK